MSAEIEAKVREKAAGMVAPIRPPAPIKAPAVAEEF
jgi:hypothetical protein